MSSSFSVFPVHTGRPSAPSAPPTFAPASSAFSFQVNLPAPAPAPAPIFPAPVADVPFSTSSFQFGHPVPPVTSTEGSTSSFQVDLSASVAASSSFFV